MHAGLRTGTSKIAVIGATGLVGEVLLAELEARGVRSERVLAAASQASVGRRVAYGAGELEVVTATLSNLTGVELVFFAATGALSAELAPALVARGAFVIDKSATFRSDPSVPLVVPAINGRLLEDRPQLVASPNCTTIGIAYALEPLRRAAGLRSVTATTMQAASGAGRAGVEALEAEREGWTHCTSPFASPLFDDVVTTCGALNDSGTTEEESKLRHELRRLLDLPTLEIDATCLRVPVRVGHTASLRVRTERPLGVEEARSVLAAFPDVDLSEVAPTPGSVAGTDRVVVGRVRRAANGDLLLVQAADNLRRGAATNALECAEGLLAATPEDPR